MRSMLALAFIVLLTMTLTSCGDSYRTLPEDKQKYSKVREMALTKDQIYQLAQTWLAKNIGDSKVTNRSSDKDAGIMIHSIIIPSGFSDGVMRHDMGCTIQIDVKEKKYRLTIDDFRWTGEYKRELWIGDEYDSAIQTSATFEQQFFDSMTKGATKAEW